MDRLDVTAQIKAIELLKCELLSGLAELYEALRKPSRGGERAALASMLINIHLLSRRLGVDFEKLSEEAVLKLRRDILEGRATADMELLIKYLGGA